MNFVGIIAEYDPFHSGHALQLRMLRQRGASTIAVCMSTGVVQRGGVPILPEAVRVRAALAAGADLVVALPAPYANASAEQFAAAGVHLLAALGCDTLAFGAETPEPAPLQAAAAALCSAAFPAALRSQLDSGLPAGGDALEGRFAVAYEPVWAIGTGKVAGPDEVLATHAVVRRLLCERLGETGNRIPILYGGSVKPANAGNLIGLDNVDGLLIGGASLDAQSFVQIIRA